jgi:NCS1 family nucleobase:cation symporter-1
MVASQVAEEVHYPDGRVGLASTDEIADSGYANGDLAPVPIERRTWTTYNYAALWIGMSHCIPTYLLASGLILVGMNWVQALVTIGLANLIVLVPMPAPSTASRTRSSPAPRSGCAAPTCRPSCGRWWPAPGSASRPGSAARGSTS